MKSLGTPRAEARPVLGPVLDALLVTAWTVLAVVTLPFQHFGPRPDTEIGVGTVVLIVVAGAATALRRRWPLVSMLVVVSATSLYLVLGYPYGPIFVFVLVTVYAMARRLPLGQAGAWAAAALALLSVHLLTDSSSSLTGLAPATAWIAVPFSIGASRRAVAEAALREREAADQRLVDAERLRLSQEVHDVVGHGLAAIQMQADIALHVQENRPEQAREALQNISRASGEALDELRGVLAAVHAESGDARAPAPTPGLARLDDLIDRVQQAGVNVSLESEGTGRSLPPGADVAAYRVLQESLTNVVKHSPHPRALVRIEHSDDAVTVSVTNQALSAVDTEGIGISGMRRRVRQVGGSFRAGPDRSAGTFTVHARFPRNAEEAV